MSAADPKKPDTVLAATLFELQPPQAWSNGRELLDALIHDCACASRGELETTGGARASLVLPSWARQYHPELGLYRLVDLRFRVLWPASDSPGIEVCAGNRFMLRSDRSGTCVIPISPAEIHDRYPEAAQWLRNASDLSLKTHLHAASVWFSTAQRAGWAPRRIPLDPIETTQPKVRSGRGIQTAEEPFKSIVLAKTPLRSPRRIDLVMIGRAIRAPHIQSIESALRRWWPSLPVSIRRAEIETDPRLEPTEVGLLVMPVDEDIQHPSWIDWLRINEAAGNLFRIVREQSLGSSNACTNLAFDLFMLAGGIPWTAAVEREDETVLGLDAGHNRDQRWSRWVCARVNVRDNATSCNIVRTELAEHIPATAIERLVPPDPAGRALTVFRDGRFHSEDKRTIAPEGMTVSVVKHPQAVLYRRLNGHLLPARFGDALLYPDGRALLQTSSNKGTATQWKMPIRISTEFRTEIEKAVTLTSLLCRQPALGVFHQPRLPAPIYWADLISKTTTEGWPKVVGRGLGLESFIP